MDRIFRNALLMSLAFHLTIFSNWPCLREAQLLRKNNKIEVTYYPLKRLSPSLEPNQQRHKINRPFLLPKKLTTISSTMIKPGIKKIPTMQEQGQLRNKENRAVSSPLSSQSFAAKEAMENAASKTTIERVKILKQQGPEERMLISYKEKDFSDEPTYLNYYNAIRAKIYKMAIANRPNYFREGEVHLIFTITRNGGLIKVDAMREISTANPILITYALTTVKKAAPFPAFLDSMKEGHLTLRLTISFEK